MKRPLLAGVFALAFFAALLASTPTAQAGLFGLGAKKVATPSPSPSAEPTATPEPPQIAIPRLQAKLKKNPDDQAAMASLAAEFLQINRPDYALPITQRLLKLGDKTAQVYYFDGIGQAAIGNFPAAAEDLQNASDLDPTNVGILGQLAEMYMRLNRPADAVRVAKRAVVFHKKDPRAYLGLGSVYAAEHQYTKARAQYRLAAKVDPKGTQSYLQIADTYAAQNNIDKALASVDQVLQIAPTDIQALVFRADLYAKEHDDAKVSIAYDDAVAAATSDGQRVAILVRKARYFAAEKKTQTARGIFSQIVSQYPKVATGFVAFGDYYASQNNLMKAQQEWRAALNVNKNSAPALLRLGQYELQSGHVPQAVGYLNRYVAVSPDPQGYALLGQAYTQAHNYKSARTACGKSFSLQESPDTLGCIGGADFELRKYSEAAKVFDALDRGARRFLESNPQLLFIAAKSYAKTNQPAKALGTYQRVLRRMRKGTPAYKEVENYIVNLRRAMAAKKKP
ncbi:MAG: tetratricopeptide repeat protein [Vulcanimicrobiaceae bacterium]